MYVTYDENINSHLKTYFPIIKVITGRFSTQCEVIIHDFSNYDISIHAMMENIKSRKNYYA